MERGVTAGGDGDEVADDCSGGRRDDANASGECRKRALTFGVEQAFLLKPALDLLECKLQRSCAHGLKVLGDKLDLAALLVNGDASTHQNLQAVFGAEAQQRRLAAEENGGDLAGVVLQGEINVAGRGGAEVGDFTLDPYVRELALHFGAEFGDQLAYLPDAALEGLHSLKCEPKLLTGLRRAVHNTQVYMQLLMKAREKVEHKGEQNAQQDRGSEGKIDGDVFAAPGEVAGEMAERNTEATEQVDDRAGQNKHKAKADENSREGKHSDVRLRKGHGGRTEELPDLPRETRSGT